MMSNNNTPPPWSEAPLKFKWIAQDEEGPWFVYETKPEILREEGSSGFGYWGNGGVSRLLKWSDPNPNWRDTLQKRPENE